MNDDELEIELKRMLETFSLEDSLRRIVRYAQNQELYGGAFEKIYYPGDEPPSPPIGWSGLPK